jgi:hypothetical protein
MAERMDLPGACADARTRMNYGTVRRREERSKEGGRTEEEAREGERRPRGARPRPGLRPREPELRGPTREAGRRPRSSHNRRGGIRSRGAPPGGWRRRRKPRRGLERLPRNLGDPMQPKMRDRGPRGSCARPRSPRGPRVRHAHRRPRARSVPRMHPHESAPRPSRAAGIAKRPPRPPLRGGAKRGR